MLHSDIHQGTDEMKRLQLSFLQSWIMGSISLEIFQQPLPRI